MAKTDQRTRLTKMLIRKAFTGLLKEKPVQSISVKELCEHAGINRGTFYAHYADIYDLLKQIEEEMMKDFMAALQPLLDSVSGDLTFSRITAETFRCLIENADLCAVTLGKYGDKEFASRLLNIGREKCMESYMRLFSGATPAQIEYYYTFVSAGCIGLLEKWIADGMTASAEEVASIAESLMMKGIEFLRS